MPSNASPATQDALAYKLWQQRGWSPWTCARITGLPAGGSGGPKVAAKIVVRPPIGHFDSVRASASGTGLTVVGWALDRSSAASAISVRISMNSVSLTSRAGLGRADVGRVMNVSGAHGFRVPVPAKSGTYKVCVTALGRRAGNNVSLGCRTVTVRPTPRGSIDAIRAVNGKVVVVGWAYDPNSPSRSTAVHVYVNGVGYSVGAVVGRADVNASLRVGGRHGFRAALPLRPGLNRVCVFAIGAGGGSHQLLSCRTVRLAGPIGSIDKVAVTAGRATIIGWSVDPNVAAKSNQVHVFVNGVGYPVLTTVIRADVNRTLKIAGVHGFRLTAALKVGANKVCAIAIGNTAGNHTSLGCVTVRR